MDLYQRLNEKSMAKLYFIARHCGDYATANRILEICRERCGAVAASE
jgi:hypothetical protein